MNDKANNLVWRIITGSLIIVLIIGSALLGLPYFASLFAIVAFFSCKEYVNIAQKLNKSISVSNVYATSLISYTASVFCIAFGKASLILSIVLPIVVILFALSLRKTASNSLEALVYEILPIFYIALPLSCLSLLCKEGLLIAFFVLIWTGDIMAYVGGSLFGRHKFSPKWSPNKSWEGFFTGLAFSIAMGAFIAYLMGKDIRYMLIFAALVYVFASIGDLFESMLKRTAQIKDSGSMLKGHGGFLDRFDSTLFAAPLAVLLIDYI